MFANHFNDSRNTAYKSHNNTYSITLHCFSLALEEEESGPVGTVTKESLLLVILWVAMETVYNIQGANSTLT